MATGDALSLVVQGAAITDDHGHTPRIDGCVVGVKFAGMGRRDPINDPVVDGSKLTINVSDPGFDTTGAATTVNRTIKGTLGLRNTYPNTWASLGSTVPAKSWCCTGSLNTNLYYTIAGGTKGATAPTNTIGTGVTNPVGQPVPADQGTPQSDGGVTWIPYASGVIAGYVEAVSGSDVIVYIALDDAIYAGTTIVSATIAAGAYTVGAAVSTAVSIPSTANNSTLAYEIPQVLEFSYPHMRSTGSLPIEVRCDHPRGMNYQMVACVKAQAWDASRANSSSIITIAAPSKSALVTTASPGGAAVEIYGGTLNTSAIPTGNAFWEYEVFPWLGTRTFKSQTDGDAADFVSGTTYAPLNMLMRNGANIYSLSTLGGGAATVAPTHTTGSVTGADGYGWTFFGNDATKHNSANPNARVHFYNDPSNLYKKGFAFVDPSGTATGVTGVFSTFAAASAAKGTLSNCYATIQLAGAALQTYNNTSGGGLTTHNDPGGGEIYCKAGSYAGFGASMQSLNIGAEWLYVYADPAAAAGTVIFANNATQTIRACSKRHWQQGFTSTATASTDQSLIDPATDGLTPLAQPITELAFIGNSVAGFNTSSTPIGRVGMSWVRNNTFTVALVLGNENTRATVHDFSGNSVGTASILQMWHYIGNRIIGSAPVQDAGGLSFKPARMFISIADNFITGTSVGSNLINVLIGPTNPYRGAMVVGNIVETVAAAGNTKAMQMAADVSTGDMSNVGIFYNTMVGERMNIAYDDQTATPIRSQWYGQLNLTQTRNSVADYFAHAGSTKGVGRYQNYWQTYGVGWKQNLSFQGSGSGAATFKQDTTSPMRVHSTDKWGPVPLVANESAQFVDNRSTTGTTTGGGDYHPAAGAQALSMAGVQMRKYDRSGALRLANGAVGALEANTVPIVWAGGDMTMAGTWSLAAAKTLGLTGGAMTMAGTWTLAPGAGLAFAGGAMTFGGTWTTATAKQLAFGGGAMTASGTWGLQTSTIPQVNPFVGFRNYVAFALPDDGFSVGYTP